MYDLSSDFDFKNWYVLQVFTGREIYYKDIIKKKFDEKVRLIIFSKEIIHKKNDRYVTLSIPLFPGYIFIQDKIDLIYSLFETGLKKEYIKPVKFNEKPAKVSIEEMKILLLTSNFEGKIPLSYGYKNGDQIIITEGPLKNFQGKIVFFNEKKKKAKVELKLFERTIYISLGVELIRRNDNTITNDIKVS